MPRLFGALLDREQARSTPITDVEWDGHQTVPLPDPCKICRASRAGIAARSVGSSARWVFERLKPAERRLCRRHPVACYKVRDTERLATAAAERLFTSREPG